VRVEVSPRAEKDAIELFPAHPELVEGYERLSRKIQFRKRSNKKNHLNNSFYRSGDFAFN